MKHKLLESEQKMMSSFATVKFNNTDTIKVTVMEPLKDFVGTLLQLDEVPIFSMFAKMALCVHVLHKCHFMHGDISLHNFMLREQDPEELGESDSHSAKLFPYDVVIIDFETLRSSYLNQLC